MITWTSVRIVLPYNIGNLGEKKVNAIAKQLSDNGMQINAKVNMPDTSVVLILNERNDNLILAPTQIAYISTIQTNNIDFDGLTSHFKMILDALLIDDTQSYILNFEGNSETEDSHFESIKVFREKLGELPQEIYGVGYRFLIKTIEFVGEFKVEPMINNSALYYYQLLLNSVQPTQVDKVLKAAEKEVNKNYEGQLQIVKG